MEKDYTVDQMKSEEPYVLVVDDEEDIVFFIELYFNRKHTPVKKAYNLSAAAHLISVTPPRLLIIDDHLPDGSGWNFISDIIPDLTQTFIIFISAHNSKVTTIQGIHVDQHFVMAKPFTVEMLDQKMRSASSPMLQNLIAL